MVISNKVPAENHLGVTRLNPAFVPVKIALPDFD